jgi:hypothetical protein
MRLFLVYLSIFLHQCLWGQKAQNPTSDLFVVDTLSMAKNSIVVAQKEFFDALEQSYQYKNPNIAGYRIQLVFHTDYDKDKSSLALFKNKFPSEPFSELDYKEPYHRLRVGNFRTKIDALRMLLQYKKEGYNGAYIVPVRIRVQLLDANLDNKL